MVTSQIDDINNSQEIPVGKKLSVSGFFRRGAPASNIADVEAEFYKIGEWYMDQLVLLDFTELKELDSIGIRNTIPNIIKWNKELLKKGRFPISIIGDIKSDVFLAVKDKFPDEDLKTYLPWYENEEAFRVDADID